MPEEDGLYEDAELDLALLEDIEDLTGIEISLTSSDVSKMSSTSAYAAMRRFSEEEVQQLNQMMGAATLPPIQKYRHKRNSLSVYLLEFYPLPTKISKGDRYINWSNVV